MGWMRVVFQLQQPQSKVSLGYGKKTHHQQDDGGRENTTVILTICADGTKLQPSVIFKGQAYNIKWDQENPTN
jgi:hypothetical protein